MEETYHIPVLLAECLEAMAIKPNGVYLDVTFGGGGHSKAILSHLGAGGHLYSVDQDKDAQNNIVANEQFTFIASNFRYIERFIDYYGQLGKVDAILADLGVSSHHFDCFDRGFSFRSEEALLDMRMNRAGEKSAFNVINDYHEEELANIIYKYGELRQSRQLASRIAKARAERPIKTIGDLLSIVKPCIHPKDEKRQLSMLFQAIRIEVNDELKALEEMLEASASVLKKGGRLVVITYHSLEDRIVKNFMKEKGLEDSNQAQIYGTNSSLWKIITRKPILPSSEEQERNPRSRSAKLRVAQLK